MRGKLWFIGGVAAGFVLGARAGREKYEELVTRGRKFLEHPTVQEAAGAAQAQANRLYEEGKDRLGQTKLGSKLSTNGGSTRQLSSTGDPLASPTTGTTGTVTGSTSTPSSPSSATSASTSRKPGSSQTL